MRKQQGLYDGMIHVREEHRKDYSAIHRVLERAFDHDAEACLVAALREDDEFIPQLSLVAEVNRRLVGYLLLSPIMIVGEEAHYSLTLAPVAVLPEFQDRGIGSKLIHTGLKRAYDIGYPNVIVTGHPEYYPRFGFERASKYSIESPIPVSEDAFMACPLHEGGLSGVSGVVKYPDAFEAFA